MLHLSSVATRTLVAARGWQRFSAAGGLPNSFRSTAAALPCVNEGSLWFAARRTLFRRKVTRIVAATKKSLRQMKKKCAPVPVRSRVAPRKRAAAVPSSPAKRKAPARKSDSEKAQRVRRGAPLVYTIHAPAVKRLKTHELRKMEREQHAAAAQAIPSNPKKSPKSHVKEAIEEDEENVAVKRRASPYSNFVKSSYGATLEANKAHLEALTAKERFAFVSKLLTEKWKTLSDAERAQWKSDSEEGVQSRKTTKGTTRKAPLYALFMKAIYAEAAASGPATWNSNKERVSHIAKYVSEQWKKRTPEERLDFVNKAQGAGSTGASGKAFQSNAASEKPCVKTQAAASSCVEQATQRHETPCAEALSPNHSSNTTAAAATMHSNTTIIDPHMFTRASSFAAPKAPEAPAHEDHATTVTATETKHEASSPSSTDACKPAPTVAEPTTSSASVDAAHGDSKPNVTAPPAVGTSFFTEAPRSGYW